MKGPKTTLVAELVRKYPVKFVVKIDWENKNPKHNQKLYC